MKITLDLKYTDEEWALISKAAGLAHKWHRGINQLRRSGKPHEAPYDGHTQEVAYILMQAHRPAIEVAAGHLHDTVEDVEHITHDVILKEFGREVADLVFEVTNVPVDSGFWKDRFKIDNARLADASEGGQTVKMADIISNSNNVFAIDPEFAVKYLPSKLKLLHVMRKPELAMQMIVYAVVEGEMKKAGIIEKMSDTDHDGECPHCGSRNHEHLEGDTHECYDCGETFKTEEAS